MIQITPQMRILMCVDPVDFRKGIDGLAGTLKFLELDPFSGYLFVFRNKSGTSIKTICYDSQGYWLCQKRLSKGRSPAARLERPSYAREGWPSGCADDALKEERKIKVW